MPIELAAGDVRDLIARIGEHDIGAAADLEGALEWLDPREGDGDEQPFRISRYRLLIFLWYGLPRKWLIETEEMGVVAGRLARLFELAGGDAAPYAEPCRSDDVVAMHTAWESDPERASERLRELLEASGMEPPDTPALRWGDVMGPDEASVRDLVALLLEHAIEGGELSPGARGFARAQAELVEAVLAQPAPWQEDAGDAAPTALELIERERLGRWCERGGPGRREIVAAVVPLLEDAPRGPLDEPSDGRGEEAADRGPTPLEPLRWLLEQAAAEPIALTQTGALNRALVREAAVRFPEWWNAEVHGPPHREAELRPLEAVHALARKLRLLRRRGRGLRLTELGRELAAEPAALAEACARELFACEPFEAELGELQLSYLLPRPGPVERAEMDELVLAAMSSRWHSSAGALELRDVYGGIDGPLALADALGLLERSFDFDRETLKSRSEVLVHEAARPLLLRALLLRAVGPADDL